MYTYVHVVKPDSGADLVLLVDLECPHLFIQSQLSMETYLIPDPSLLVTVVPSK